MPPRRKDQDRPGVVINLPWQVTCKHAETGAQFRVPVSEATFRELQRVVFGQDELPFPDQRSS